MSGHPKLKKLNDLHRDMVMCEVLLGYSRSEILEKYKDRVCNIANVHRIMNDPLAKAYKDELRKLKVEKTIEKRLEAEKVIRDNLPGVASELVQLSLNAKSESVRAKAGRDVMWMGGFKPTDGVEEQDIPHLSVYDSKTKDKKAEGE